MNIDWSKAPEGATGAMVAHFDGGTIRRGDVEFIPNDEPCRSIYKEGPDSWVYHPAPAAPAWTGEGLPPVGTVCEARGTAYEELRQREFSWRKVEIIAHTNFGGDDIAVGRDLEYATLGWGIARKFRPIRTPEQIAAEEREKAIKQIQSDLDVPLQIARRAHDHGYRKQERQK